MKIDLKQALRGEYPIIIDGATGSNLMIAGMPNNVCPEVWITENEDVLINLQREYVKMGSMAVFAPTFGANRSSLARYGLSGTTEELNKKLFEISRKAVGDDALIMGDIAPSGLFMKPYGDAGFDEIYDIFYEQAKIIDECGTDGFIVETQLNLSETRAAVLAIKAASKKPVFVTMSMNEQGKTMSGNDIIACLLAMEAVGVDAFGCNCSVGPQAMLEVLKKAAKYASVPLIAKANAGKPHEDKNEMHFDINSDDFSEWAVQFVESGVKIIGGCCGSTPEYINKISKKIKDKKVCKVENEKIDTKYFASNEKEWYIADKTEDLPEIIECSPDLEDDLAEAEDDGQSIIRIKVNTEADSELLLNSSFMIKTPLMLTSDNIAALDRALKIYTGRAIIDPNTNLTEEDREYLKSKYNPVFWDN